MRLSWREAWWWGKLFLTLTIFACVGWEFAHILRSDELWRTGGRLRPGWAAVAAGLYLLSLACPALFWYRLLRVLGQHPTRLTVLRAYYVGQLSRYVPGKVVGLMVRARLLSGPGVSTSAAALAVVYEALTTLLTGAVLATVLLSLGAADLGERRWLALGLLVLLGIPLLPAVFNRLSAKVAARFPSNNAVPPAPLKAPTLAQGLLVTACGWGLQGASLWALLQGLLPQAQPWSWATWGTYTAFVALATTLGFLVVAAPGGLGVRELLLQQALVHHLAGVWGTEQAALTSVLAVLLLRLVWVVAELVAAGLFYWAPTHTAGAVPVDQKMAS